MQQLRARTMCSGDSKAIVGCRISSWVPAPQPLQASPSSSNPHPSPSQVGSSHLICSAQPDQIKSR